MTSNSRFIGGVGGTPTEIVGDNAATMGFVLNRNVIDFTGSAYTQVTSGTTTGASISAAHTGVILTGPSTATGGIGGRIAAPTSFAWRRGLDYTFNASLRVDFRASRLAANESNSIWRVSFGKNFSSAIGPLAARGFGIRQVGTGALDIIAHNGTTETIQQTTFTPTLSSAFDASLRYNTTTGDVALFVNGAQVGATTGSAVGSGVGLSTPTLWLEIQNTNTVAVQPIAGVFRPLLWFAD